MISHFGSSLLLFILIMATTTPSLSNCLPINISNTSSDQFAQSIGDSTRLGVVGGHYADTGEWPMIASLQLKEGMYQHFCGGTVWNSQYILTAAHCLFNSDSTAKPWPIDKLSVVVGQADLSTALLGSGNRYAVAEAKAHESYRGPANAGYDIAVLKLKEKIDFKKNPEIACTCRPKGSGGKNINTKECYVVGWGAESEGATTGPSWLKEANVPVRDDKYCASHNGGKATGLICAGLDQGGRDGCQGDSGGPLFCSTTQKEPFQFIQVGVVSFGVGCALANEPGYYTDVNYYNSWIKGQTGCG